MNIEAYSYTVLSAFLGITIVFVFLGFLCVFMVLIKRLFEEKNANVEIAVAAGAAATAASVETAAAASDDADWITAAVAAYLEEEDSPRSALSWVPGEKEKSDPWVVTPRVQKTYSGV